MNKNLTLNAVGGTVTLDATQSPPDGKAILDAGGSGVTVAINGFAFTGAAVSSGNGAGIRYEGGTLNIANSHFYGNQDGILGAPDSNGVITIDHSEFNNNGAGDGYTHNIYIGDIHQFTLTNSYVHDALVGHEVKSRAENNTITNNRILDNTSNASYEIDLPNGGNATISGNTIQQSAASQNPNIIAYGEEGSLHSGTALSVSGNTIVNDLGRGPALWNAGSATATFSNNAVYGFGSNALVNGAANSSGTTVLGSRPTLDTSAPYTVPTAPAATGAGLVINVAEDAYQGDAQFTVSVDGEQVGGVYTATASHAAGQSQAVTVAASLSAGTHQVGVTFLNDAYGGSSAADRNLFVTGERYNGVAIAGAAAPLLNDGTAAALMNTGTVAQPSAPSTSGLVLTVSEDAYLGDAEFLVTIDGAQTGVYSATASHAAGQSQAITVAGVLSAGSHTVAVSFINDVSGSGAGQDRNLYVQGASYNGTAIAGVATPLFSDGTDSFAVTGAGAATPAPTPVPTPAPAPPVSTPVTSGAGLVVNVAEDAYLGDAQFTVTVDGKATGGTYTASASHAAGQSQAVTIASVLGNGPHQVGVSFINDAYGGTDSTDRNLFVTGASYNGTAITGAAAPLFRNGTDTFTATSALASTVVLNVAEDAYQGDAQFTVAVDGKQVGGTYTATASHAAGQTQAITLAGVAETFSAHDVAVTFLNDAYAGTPSTDRNLYLVSGTIDGQTAPGASLSLFSAGTQHVSMTAPSTFVG